MRQRASRNAPPPPEQRGSDGRLIIQILICTTLICGFMFFSDTKIGGTTPRQVATRFINYTVDLKDTLTDFKEAVIPVSGEIKAD